MAEQRRDRGADELGDLVRRQLQDFACQMANRGSKFIQDREVICGCSGKSAAVSAMMNLPYL